MDLGQEVQLVSVGLVSEDGREYYAVSKDFEPGRANQWVWQQVLSQLPPMGSPEWKNLWEIAEEVAEFCDPKLYGRPEFWGWFCSYDWVALCSIFGSMKGLPEGWTHYCRDIKLVADLAGGPRLPKKPKDGRHTAIVDARWNKVALEYLEGLSLFSIGKSAYSNIAQDGG